MRGGQTASRLALGSLCRAAAGRRALRRCRSGSGRPGRALRCRREPRVGAVALAQGTGTGRDWVGPMRRSSWRARSSRMPAASARRASSDARCECWGRSSASRVSSICARASSCSSARRPEARAGVCAPRARHRAAARAYADAKRASRSGARSSWPIAATRSRSPSRREPSSTRPAVGHAERRSPAWSPSRRASAESPSSQPSRPHQQGDRAGTLRDAQDGRAPSLPRLPQARHPFPARAAATVLGAPLTGG